MPNPHLSDSRFRLPMHLALPMLLVLLLSACAGGSSLSSIKQQALTAVSSYTSAQRYFDRGDIMLARRAAERTISNRPDYQQAQKLLREQIEPARKRLLQHYRLAAMKAEKKGVMYQALENYLKAAEFSVDDDIMLNNAKRVDLILRQKRIDNLSAQRRSEDAQLLAMLDQYIPPRGMDPKDIPFARELDRLQDQIQSRARKAWDAAKRELHENHPEVAYVEAESYQRLRPGSNRGILLMQEVSEALPKGLDIPGAPRGGRPGKRSVTAKGQETPTSDQIRQLMQEDKWVQAREFAMIYLRDGGDDADTLLQNIDKSLKKQAEAAFKVGQIAFQSEQLDKAVEAWAEASSLQPENRDYADSLRRATELQESFRILQNKNTNAD